MGEGKTRIMLEALVRWRSFYSTTKYHVVVRAEEHFLQQTVRRSASRVQVHRALDQAGLCDSVTTLKSHGTETCSRKGIDMVFVASTNYTWDVNQLKT